jgi:site-specific DNA-methyltransferase (adenine-specific)
MELKIEYLPIKALKPYEKNTRKHQKKDVDNIARSIEKYGMCDAIGIWGEQNIIVEGHGRLLACKQLGMTEVPCVRLDHLTDEQRREYAIAHNATAELSEWDLDVLPDELAELDLSDFDFDFGIEDEEEETEIVEDEAPEVDEDAEPIAKLGDIWQLGRHRLMCGDSTSIDDVEKLMGGQLADMLLTDPPYNVAYEGKTKDHLTIQNDSMDNDSFRQFLRDAFTSADTVMKKGAVFYIWHADSEGYNFRGACFDIGWKVRQCLVWNKNSMVMGRQDYHWKHEPCLYGWKEGASHLWASDRKQTTVIDYQRPTKADIHPTMKPVGLFDYQIKNNTKGGDVVLDLFNGSGTTIMACEQNGRVARCMELDPRYVDACVKRWENFTGEKAVLLNDSGSN